MQRSGKFTLAFAPAFVLLAAAGAAQVSTETVDGVTNFRQLRSTVACAGAVTPASLKAVKEMGYASVVNLRQGSEEGANVEAGAAAASAAGLKYIHIPMNGAAPDAAAFDQFIEAAKAPANQPMFVHCASGNRAAAVWLAKRLVVDQWPVERASEEAQALGLRSEPLKQFTLDYAKARRQK